MQLAICGQACVEHPSAVVSVGSLNIFAAFRQAATSDGSPHAVSALASSLQNMVATESGAIAAAA
jgi:hypothetical protein